MTANATSQDIPVDTTRGSLLTDIQSSAESVPMPSTTTQMALNDTTSHDIYSILERPVNLGTFEWKTSDPALAFTMKYSDYLADTRNYLQQFNFPQDIFAKSPLVVDKLKNYQYFKADIELEVKVNAQPFLQGGLMLVYNPYYNQTSEFRRKGTRYMASQTTCPNKRLSIEHGDSLKITCPYANIYDMFDLNNPDNQFGSAFLYVFSALLGPSAAETVKYTVFARFVNPQFSVPTHNDVISNIRSEHDIKRLEAKGYRVAQSDVQPTAAKDTGEVEASGPVSKIAGGVTTIADVLSGIPAVGKLASSVAWVSRAIGRTAASFGWSKPTSIQPQSKIVAKPNHTLIHTEGNDDATTLALLQDNGIDGTSFIPENKDEMSLKYIFGRPNFFHAITASTELFSARKKITAWEVSPLSQYQYGDTEDSQTLFLGGFAYASMLGTLWRGSINFDISVYKTVFHKGRFVAVFLPETNLTDVPDTLDQVGNLINTNYAVICDLKDKQDEEGRGEFRITVPFISNTNWRETYKRTTNVSNPGPDATTLDTKTGCVAIYSLVDLSAPPSVAGAVTFYVAHSGGEDYQIARPVMNLAPGFQSRYAQSDTGSVFIPQDENLLVPAHKSQDVTAQTTGEYFKSLRALMKRYGWFANLTQDEDFVGLRTRHMTEDPDSGKRVMSRQNLINPALPTPWYMSSFLYRFYNGSSQTKIVPYTAGLVSDAFLSFDEDTASQTLTPKEQSYGQPVFQQNQQVSNVFEVRTPYYRGVRCDVVGSNQVPVLGDVRTNLRCRNLASYGGTTQASSMYEAAGDDFNFFFLVGPPPMSDIRNVKEFGTFPSGNVFTVDIQSSNLFVSLTAPYTPNTLAARGCTFTPALISVGDNVYGRITASEEETIPLALLSGGTASIPVTACSIQDTDQITPTLYLPYDNSLVDFSATKILWNSIDAFRIVTDYPVS